MTLMHLADLLPASSMLPAGPDPAFDRLAQLAKRHLDVPLVLVSLVSQTGQIYPGAAGLPPDIEATRFTPLSHSFCRYVVAGSDVASMRTVAVRDGDDYVVDGEKSWISNGGIADFYVVFCRLGDADREFVALVVEPGDPGFSVTERIETISPHPLATLRLSRCRVPASRVVGTPGKGLRVALGTLDVFRTTVGAAALGFARRALDESLKQATTRRMFGATLADLPLAQAKLADMATAIDASALLVYRAAWTRDEGAERITREAAMAKMFATEAAQRVIDDAVQLLGARGVTSGHPVERLYREIRALRIYEGTTEVQQLVIAGQVLAAHAAGRSTDG